MAQEPERPDILAKWKNPQAQQPPALGMETFQRINQSASIENPAGDQKQYAAYDNVKGRPQTRLRIRRLTDVSMAPDYRLLSNVVFNDYGEEFTLWYPFMQVRVIGHHLTEIAEAIMDGTCPFIRDYDAREYPVPLAKGQPVIERIDIDVTDQMKLARGAEKEPGQGMVLEMDKGRGEGRGGIGR